MDKLFTKAWWLDEARSFTVTMLAFLAADGASVLAQIYSGNFDRVVMWQFALALVRSSVKAVLTLAIPKAFPHRSSNQ